MNRDILIISDDLIEPPSELLPFRTVTMFAHENLDMEILLHTTQEMKDVVYHWMKPRGLLDYVSYILNEFEFESGVRIDVVRFYSDTIVVKSIRLENQLALLGQIRMIAGRPI